MLVPVTMRGLVSAAYMHSLDAATAAFQAEQQEQQQEEEEGTFTSHTAAAATAAPSLWPGISFLEAEAGQMAEGAAASEAPSPRRHSSTAVQQQQQEHRQQEAALSAVQNAALCDLIERELEDLVRPHLEPLGLQPLRVSMEVWEERCGGGIRREVQSRSRSRLAVQKVCCCDSYSILSACFPCCSSQLPHAPLPHTLSPPCSSASPRAPSPGSGSTRAW